MVCVCVCVFVCVSGAELFMLQEMLLEYHKEHLV